MFKFPPLFTAEEEKNLTLPPMRSFAATNNISLKGLSERRDIVDAIQSYANMSDDNCEKVQCWFDDIVTEGIKELHVRRVDLNPQDIVRLKDSVQLSKIFDGLLINANNRHYIGNCYTSSLDIVDYSLAHTNVGDVLTVRFCEILDIFERRADGPVTSMMYPMCIHLYIDKGILVARGKSKANLYQHIDGEFSLEKLKTTNVEKEIAKAFNRIEELLGISAQSKSEVNQFFKEQLFLLLQKHTQTPQEIIEMMMEKKATIDAVVGVIAKDICNVPDQYIMDIEADVNNMVEKYFSITRSDKSIFTEGKPAYPLKISATDEEESKVEQTAAFEEPLQSKAVFFDNRKMMQKSQVCDGVWFMFQRLNSRYYTKQFKVKAQVKNNTAILRFPEYTAEEDLQNVLFSFVNAGK